MKKLKNEKQGKIPHILKGLASALIITLIFIAVAAALVTYTDMAERLVTYMAFASNCISAFVCGFITSRGAKNKGALHGLFSGLLYAVILLLAVKTASKTGFMSSGVIFTLLQCILCGALGGILGINTKK